MPEPSPTTSIIKQSLQSRGLERYTLDNGLTAVFQPNHRTALFSAQIWVRTGSLHEGDHLGCGISHYLEHMIFKGTERHSYTQISERLHAEGAHINAYTTFDRTVYYVDGPIEALETALDVLSDIYFNSSIDVDEAKKEKAVIFREIDMGLDDPDHRLSQQLFQSAFRLHPYKYPVIGERELFAELESDDLKQYYKDRYVPNNTTFVLCGDIESNRGKELTQKYFSIHRREVLRPKLWEAEPEQCGLRSKWIEDETQVTRGSMAFRSTNLSHPDAPALDILARILGGGFSSILWQRLREKEQMVHHIDVTNWSPSESGLFWISYSCDHGKVDEVEACVWEELHKLASNGCAREPIQKATQQIAMAELNARKTISAEASRLGLYEVVANDLNFSQFYFSKLNQINAECVQAVASKYFQEHRLNTVALGKSSKPNASASNKKTKPQEFTAHHLSNGIRVITKIDKHLPKVQVRSLSLGGPLYEDHSSKGLTALMATMLARDTRNKSAQAIAELIESRGGSFNEFAGNNSFGLSIEMLASDQLMALDILSESLQEPAFLESTFDTEREGQIAYLKECMDDAVDAARYQLREQFFGEHPYAHNAYGTIQALSDLCIDHCTIHHKKLVQAQNLVISACGDLDPEHFCQELETRFSSIKRTDHPLQTTSAKLEQPSRTGLHHLPINKEQCIVTMAYKDAGIADYDSFVIGDLVDEFFSGMSSGLFKKVREEAGMAYFVHSSRMVGYDTGMFSFCAGTTDENHSAVVEAINSEIKRLQEAHSITAEIQRCKTQLKSKKRMAMQSLSAQTMHAGLNTLYGLPINDTSSYSQRVDAISISDIQSYAKRFTPDHGLTLIFSNPKDTKS